MMKSPKESTRNFRLYIPSISILVAMLAVGALSVAGIISHSDSTNPTGFTDEEFESLSVGLLKTDTLCTSLVVAQKRMDDLRSIVLAQQSDWVTLHVSREDGRVQARLFFAAILAGLVALALPHGSDVPSSTRGPTGSKAKAKEGEANQSHSVRRRRRYTYIVLVVVTGVMYLYDVHSLDLMHRNTLIIGGLKKTLDSLLAVSPLDGTWHTLDFTATEVAIDTAAEFTKRIVRKASMVVQPGAEQTSTVFCVY